MLRHMPYFGVLLIAGLFCLVLIAIQIAIAEDMPVGEVVWSGECAPDGVEDGALTARCGDGDPMSVGAATTAEYAGAAIAGRQPATLACDVVVRPITGARYLSCAPLDDDPQ